jgi:hypothetical protein
MAARTNATKKQLRPTSSNRDAIKTKLAEHDAALDALTGATQNEHVSASGAIDPAVALTTLAIDGTKAYTLAAGTKAGQRKRIRCTAATNTPAGTVTATLLNGNTAATSFLMNAAEDTVDLVWNGSAWCIGLAISVSIT